MCRGLRKSCWAWTLVNWAKLPQLVSYPQIFCSEQAIGSRPLHSGHCPQLWLQWITTWSPGRQRLTCSPTFQTIPEASDPAMWNGSPCILKTLTGLPRAAHTPLKFRPAAITSPRASFGPTGGRSTSSICIAAMGSPSRPGRMTLASILRGRTPGSGGTSPRGKTSLMLRSLTPRGRNLRAPRPARAAFRRTPSGGERLLCARALRGGRPCRRGGRPFCRAFQKAVDVPDPEREVVERVSALLEKLLQARVAAERLLRRYELERGPVREVEEGRAHFLRRDHFPVRALLPEQLLDERDRGIDVLHADRGMVEPGGGNAGRGSRHRRGSLCHRVRLPARDSFDGSHDLAERRLRPEYRRHPERLEPRPVRGRNDSSHHHRNARFAAKKLFLESLADRFVRAGEDGEPDHVDVFLHGGGGDGGHRRAQARVDDLHASVAQRGGDHAGAAVVAVEPGLADEDADLFHSKPRRGLVGAESFAQDRGDFTQGAVRRDSFADERLEVVGSCRRVGEPGERRLCLRAVPLPPHPLDARLGLLRSLRVRQGQFHVRLLVRVADRPELVHADDRHLALLHRALVLVRALRDAVLDVPLAKALDHPAARLDLGEDAIDRPLHLVGERLDEVASSQRIGGLRYLGLVGDDLLDPQRGARGKLGGNRERFVIRGGEDALHAGAGDGERLERRAGDVVERLGPGQRMTAADEGGAQPPALRLLRAVAVAEELRPDAPRRPVLRHLFEEVRVRIEKEGEPGREAVGREPAADQLLDVRLAGGERVRRFFRRSRPRVSIMGGDADRIEPGKARDRVLDQIAGEAHRRLDGKEPRAAGAEFLEQVVLHRSAD